MFVTNDYNLTGLMHAFTYSNVHVHKARYMPIDCKHSFWGSD